MESLGSDSKVDVSLQRTNLNISKYPLGMRVHYSAVTLKIQTLGNFDSETDAFKLATRKIITNEILEKVGYVKFKSSLDEVLSAEMENLVI